MLSFRSFSRSAPRVMSRMTSSAVRIPLYRPSLLQPTARLARTQIAAAFSTTRITRSKTGEIDESLLAKLDSEIQVEEDLKDEELSTSVKDYLENGPFEIIDTPGVEDVVLKRQFGNEQITVTFSIADLNNLDPEADYQDRALNDEEDVDGLNENDGRNPKNASEDSLAAAEGEAEDFEQDPSFPARLNVIVEKNGRGALAIEATAQNGNILIENVFHYANAAHAHAKSAEQITERQDLYVGPPFSNLDEELQVLLEEYLDERGVDTALAVFVPDYIDMKEQKEYVRWLSNVKDFVAA